jgi:hypothetical protein
LGTGVTAAEVALWVEATLRDDSAPVYLGENKSVEAAGETRWYSWGWGASHLVLDAAVEEALQVPVMKDRNMYRNGNNMSIMRFEAFTAMKIKVKIIWVVMLYSDVTGYQHFRRPCCLHLEGK